MIHKAQADAEHAQSGNPGQCVPCGADIHRVPGGRGPVWVHTRTGMVTGSQDDALWANMARTGNFAGISDPDEIGDIGPTEAAIRLAERRRIIGQDREALQLMVESVDEMREAEMVVSPSVAACQEVVRRLLEA